jgi:hypothetical protein
MQFIGFSPYGLPSQIPRSNAPGDPSTPRLDGSQEKLSLFFQFTVQICTHESIFHVIGFSDGSNTRDVVGRICHIQTAFDVAATTSS